MLRDMYEKFEHYCNCRINYKNHKWNRGGNLEKSYKTSVITVIVVIAAGHNGEQTIGGESFNTSVVTVLTF